MFIDTAKVFVKSGDGGNGGNVILVADTNMTTLMDFTYKKKYVAENGSSGSGSKCFGKTGEDLYIKVPVGTVIRDEESGKIMADLSHGKDTFVVAKGGRGGKGNVRFCTPTRQAPNFAEPGMPGEERWVKLELKLLADIGLLGFPNVGKSTLLSVVSKARPKIADYHFTTLKPNLGVVSMPGIQSFVMADIPGIIEGAAEGTGLGLQFLRHIERTRLLIHVVDISGIEGRNPIEDFDKINEELKKYSIKLWDRPQIIAANKCDILGDDKIFEDFKKELNERGYDKVYKISAATRQGVDELIKDAARILSTIPIKELEINEEEKYTPEEKHFVYNITKEDDVYVIEGSFVDRLLSSVNINEPDSLKYFHKVLKNKGVIDKLIEMGIQDGDIVRLNDFEFEFMF